MTEKEQKKLMKELQRRQKEVQKKQQELQNAFQKVAKNQIERQRKLLEETIPKCSDCKETKNRVILCPTHLEELKAIVQELGDIELSFKLKIQYERMRQMRKRRR